MEGLPQGIPGMGPNGTCTRYVRHFAASEAHPSLLTYLFLSYAGQVPTQEEVAKQQEQERQRVEQTEGLLASIMEPAAKVGTRPPPTPTPTPCIPY